MRYPVLLRVRLDRQTDRNNQSRILSRSSWDLSEIDYCCPEVREIDREMVREKVKENIERISCLIPTQAVISSMVIMMMMIVIMIMMIIMMMRMLIISRI